MDEAEQIQRLAEARYACFLRMRSYFQSSNATEPVRRQCPVVWDNVLCWDHAPPGTLQSQRCPDYIHGFDTRQNATKVCTENGSWYYNPEFNRTWTNLTACYDKAILPKVKDISVIAAHADTIKLLYTVGYGVSLGSLIIAVIIMCCGRRLKSKSNTLHVNLFLAFILRAALSFAKQALFVEDLGFDKDVRRVQDGRLEFVPDGTHWECRTLVSLFFYSICVSQMWIFMEGLYLHMLIYSTLSTERRGVRLYVLMGWLSPLLFFIPWVIAKATTDNHFCWTISDNPNLIWILDGPLMATVIVNFVFFLHILWVLVLRVRSADRHSSRQQQYRRLAKFILVLVPLFGVLYIVFYVVFPMSFSSEPDILHLYMEMVYNSFQGFVLALLFCFLNEEVQAEMRRLWNRKKSLRRNSMVMTRSFAFSSFRKPSLHQRGQNSFLSKEHASVLRQVQRQQQKQKDGKQPPVRSSPDSSSSSARSDDWLLRIKERARAVIFLRKKSSESQEGVMGMQAGEGCGSADGPAVDVHAMRNGPCDGMLDTAAGQDCSEENECVGGWPKG